MLKPCRFPTAMLVVPLAATLCVALPASAATAPVPTVETGPAITIGPRGAIISGVINPSGRIVHYWIAFGRKKPSEHHTGLSEERVGGNEPTGVEEVVENLRKGTTYRYRLVVIYGHGTKKVFGAERSFTTKCYAYDSHHEVVVKPCRR